MILTDDLATLSNEDVDLYRLFQKWIDFLELDGINMVVRLRSDHRVNICTFCNRNELFIEEEKNERITQFECITFSVLT